MLGGIVRMFRILPTSFVPNEDQGYVLGQVVMPDAATLARTVQTSATKSTSCSSKNPAVEHRTVVNGYSLIDSQYKSNVATVRS